MKEMKFTRRLLGVICMISLLFSCSPEDGEDGATGPQGPQGAQGEQGNDGENGEAGTANVIYSPWITSGFEDNVQAVDAIFTIDAPLLTDEIVQQGVVLAYGKIIIFSDEDVLPLPVTIPSINESYYHRIENVGELQIRIMSLDFVTNIGPTLFNEYRYVLIPGGTSTGKSSTAPDYTKMSYEEIKELFDLQD